MRDAKAMKSRKDIRQPSDLYKENTPLDVGYNLARCLGYGIDLPPLPPRERKTLPPVLISRTLIVSSGSPRQAKGVKLPQRSAQAQLHTRPESGLLNLAPSGIPTPILHTPLLAQFLGLAPKDDTRPSLGQDVNHEG